jgi:two-component system response regulator RegA
MNSQARQVRIDTALVVDDDDVFRQTLAGALRRRGVAARTAATVEEALIEVEEKQVDLLIVDYRMPRGDGVSGLPRFRHALPGAVIIVLTGYGDIALAVRAVHEGADTMLLKPVEADQLLREAMELRARPRQAGTQHPATTLSYNLEVMERDAIKAALKESDGVIARAAKLLGIDRRTLQRKLKKIY